MGEIISKMPIFTYLCVIPPRHKHANFFFPKVVILPTHLPTYFYYTYLTLIFTFYYGARIIKLSKGEICAANFIPPANGASQGNYFKAKMAVFKA